ncbi:unnamed protein product [Triticum turgidum subsp. durum]|uniref:Phosphatidic acid phosphatase type 2/haloperoxidase domain-containing protein n=1 Tax=Triticum turgidum subsp. durum TaxID=4567 RepID=A0A9R1BQS7_TRITD|nr:unnamed protein product [Triticum turgidum subsp. durum]
MPPPATPAPSATVHPCLRTHGKEVARLHLFDWIVLLLLVATIGLLGLVQPFHRFVSQDMMADLRYPMKRSTVPDWAVPVRHTYTPHLPMKIMLWVPYITDEIAAAVSRSLLFSVLITAIVTVAIKDAVGRPRPDFFWRCFPDGVPKYDNVTGDVICHGKPGAIKEGYKSFPSGHASGAFAGLGFLSWYLAGKMKAFDRRGHIAKLCIVLLPLLSATMVAVSRVTDYWHHWQDVFAGGVLEKYIMCLLPPKWA